MSDINPILCILNPRELPHFLNSVKRINQIDKLWLSYIYPERDAYKIMRDWFLDHREYTHLIICPDDVILYKSNIDYILKDLEEYDPPVMTGYSNINLTDKFNLYTISLFNHIPYRYVPYQLLERKTLFSDKGIPYYGNFFKVGWTGFSLTTIRRDIIRKIAFEDDAEFNGMSRGTVGCCVDSMFSHRCNEKGIDMFCDPRVKIVHLRIRDASIMTNFYAGVKERNVRLEKAK